jgi:protein-tyrosine phosphatase
MQSLSMSHLARIRQSLSITSAELQSFRKIDFARVTRLHFLCKGNICRSAYAEWRARRWGIAAISSGVQASSGLGADPMACGIASTRGVVLTRHKTTRFDEVTLQAGDLVLAMEPWQARAVSNRVRQSGAQLTLLGLWAPRPARIVVDPYGRDTSVFQESFDIIDHALYRITWRLRGVDLNGLPEGSLAGKIRAQGAWRGLVKPLLGWIIFHSRAYRLLTRRRAVILVLHSVIAEAGGGSLQTPAFAFEKYIRFFRRFFSMASLADIGQRVRMRKDISRQLAVTFDDGYANNHTLAAPLLEAYGVKATFFVTAGLIGTRTQAPWDARRGTDSVWMSWQQVQELASSGHEIGAHSISHRRLGQLQDDEVEREVSDSVRAIADRTRHRPRSFAVPFGASECLTPAVKASCARHGIDYVVTALGGVVTPDCSPYSLRRFPVDFSDAPSPYACGLDVLVDCLTKTRVRVRTPLS